MLLTSRLRRAGGGLVRDAPLGTMGTIDNCAPVSREGRVYASPFERRYKWSIGDRVIDLLAMNTLGGYFLREAQFFRYLRRCAATIPQKIRRKFCPNDLFSLQDRDLWLETEGSG
jgi:hypothetical protein